MAEYGKNRGRRLYCFLMRIKEKLIDKMIYLVTFNSIPIKYFKNKENCQKYFDRFCNETEENLIQENPSYNIYSSYKDRDENVVVFERAFKNFIFTYEEIIGTVKCLVVDCGEIS